MAHGLRLRDGEGAVVPQPVGALGRRRTQARRAMARRPADGGFDFAANTNIIGHAGKTLAIVESGARPYELTDELDTVGPSDFCGTLFGGYTAHPKRDPATGELHAVSYNPMRGNIVQYTVTGVDGRVRRTVDIRLQAQTMMHDFSLTEKYVVLYDLPVALDLRQALAHQARQGCRESADPLGRASRRTGFRPASGDAQIGASGGGGTSAACPTAGRRTPGAHRRDAARGHRRRHPLVRGATRATSSIRSTPMTTARSDRSCSTSSGTRRCSPPATSLSRAPVAGPVDRRPDRRQGSRRTSRRHGPGVPARRRTTGRPAAPVRIRRRLHRRGRRASPRPTPS